MTTAPPEIAWIREIREIIAAECENDPHKLFERAKQIESQMVEKVVGYESPDKPQAVQRK